MHHAWGGQPYLAQIGKSKTNNKSLQQQILAIKGLTMTQREDVAHAVSKGFDFNKKGLAWKRRGDRLYMVQVATAAVVPVLVGFINNVDSETVSLAIQISVRNLDLAFPYVVVAAGRGMVASAQPLPLVWVCAAKMTTARPVIFTTATIAMSGARRRGVCSGPAVC